MRILQDLPSFYIFSVAWEVTVHTGHHCSHKFIFPVCFHPSLIKLKYKMDRIQCSYFSRGLTSLVTFSLPFLIGIHGCSLQLIHSSDVGMNLQNVRGCNFKIILQEFWMTQRNRWQNMNPLCLRFLIRVCVSDYINISLDLDKATPPVNITIAWSHLGTLSSYVPLYTSHISSLYFACFLILEGIHSHRPWVWHARCQRDAEPLTGG